MIVLTVILGVLLALFVGLTIHYYIRVRVLEKTRADVASVGEEIARRIGEDARQSLEESRRGVLTEALTPVQDGYERLMRAMNEVSKQQGADSVALKERIRDLVELSLKVQDATTRLSTSLQGNIRVQGKWGEMVLENILSGSGLMKGRDYDTQMCITAGPEGLRDIRPDAVVHFADGRMLVIDAKVSLDAYYRYLGAKDDTMARAAEREHAMSVGRHVSALVSKSYQRDVDGKQADFVLMFVPNEGAFALALNADQALWQRAFEGGIIMVSPTLLMVSIKIVEQMWRASRREKNIDEIARQATLILDSLRAFVHDYERLESAMGTATKAMEQARIHLTGRQGLMRRAEQMEKLGARPSQSIDYSKYETDE